MKSIQMKIIFTPILLLLFINFNYAQVKEWANLKKYQAENQSVKPMKNAVVLMGDSITEFWKTNSPDFFANYPLIDRGISGQTTSQMVVRFEQDVIALKPKTVVILAGINDIAENTGPITLEAVFDNIEIMVNKAKAHKIKPILCSVLPANKFWWNSKIYPADKVIALNKMIKAYALKNKITYVDYYSVMVDTDKGLQFQYGEDGVHPNPTGYKIMERLLLKALY
ncbi:MAG: acylhydrolase [Flavobacterium sp.]|jgi:lysophospholipase L1-like esterase|uniref:GDSL-type esterase/lipase family protein n=1 Tax=Flavobacterium sp. TaxID=239 RepID=UPI0025C0A7C2|nr:GDSL-type esterase/lipase family protein [Flavobacterium sp.]MBA4133714.1 acylhydrolase [Flavobacterium sp.]